MHTPTVIAAAQLCARDEDVDYNLKAHDRLIRLAAEHKAQLLVFPEMSITGYVREAADRLAFTAEDTRLDGLRQLSAEHQMIIVAGAPVRMDSGLHIGSFIIYPDRTVGLYTKHYLYKGEGDYFTPNRNHSPMIHLDGEQISPAVCFDIENPPHVAQAKSSGATVYMPSIFYSAAAIDEAHLLLGRYAGAHSLSVLMSNFAGHIYHKQAGGGSAFWNNDGSLLASLPADHTGLVLGIKETGAWRGTIISEEL